MPGMRTCSAREAVGGCASGSPDAADRRRAPAASLPAAFLVRRADRGARRGGVGGAGRARGVARGRPWRRAGALSRGPDRAGQRAGPGAPGAGSRRRASACSAERLNPLHLSDARARTRALPGARLAELCGRLRRASRRRPRGAGAARRRAFSTRPEVAYPRVLGSPSSSAPGVPALGELRRCDLPRFFRAAGPRRAVRGRPAGRRRSDRLSPGSASTSTNSDNVHLDTEARPTKSPRAFCSVPRVPDEVYLVIAPHGGRDDYAALFHEGGHAEHYAHTDPELAFEFRMLGDNSVTESFAFLLSTSWSKTARGCASGWGWRMRRPPSRTPRAVEARCSCAATRRSSPTSSSSHGGLRGARRDARSRYSDPLSEALRVPWPRESWLADVDEGFYAACYLRAWALESRWRPRAARAVRRGAGSSRAARESGCGSCGARVSASTPKSCSPRRSARQLDFGGARRRSSAAATAAADARAT